MSDKGKGGVKNLKKWVTSFMDALVWFHDPNGSLPSLTSKIPNFEPLNWVEQLTKPPLSDNLSDLRDFKFKIWLIWSLSYHENLMMCYRYENSNTIFVIAKIPSYLGEKRTQKYSELARYYAVLYLLILYSVLRN